MVTVCDFGLTLLVLVVLACLVAVAQDALEKRKNRRRNEQ